MRSDILYWYPIWIDVAWQKVRKIYAIHKVNFFNFDIIFDKVFWIYNGNEYLGMVSKICVHVFNSNLNCVVIIWNGKLMKYVLLNHINTNKMNGEIYIITSQIHWLFRYSGLHRYMYVEVFAFLFVRGCFFFVKAKIMSYFPLHKKS